MKAPRGTPLYVGDKIYLVGKKPPNSVVGYVGLMDKLLNDGKEYTIKKITPNSKGNIINVAGWNWDARNIMKASDREAEVLDPRPFMFDVSLLDV